MAKTFILYMFMNTLLIDNHDSFSYNLLHLLQAAEPGSAVEIVYSEDVRMEDILRSRRVVLSPGPGVPEQRQGLMRSIEWAAGRRPLLGVCLGHQAIAVHFGAALRQLKHPTHGIRDDLRQTKGVLFQDMGVTSVARYHSWAVDPETLPESLEATSYSEDGYIMSLQHKELPICGVQFHPESYATTGGLQMIRNFYRL